jgi:tRNA(His) 5'-end guanylyltransferase
MFKIRPRGNSQIQRPSNNQRPNGSLGDSQPPRDRSNSAKNRSQKKPTLPHTPASGSPIERRSIGDYDRRMSKFENLQDIAFFPDMYVVVRLDAHRLGSHWSSFPDAEYPLGAAVAAGMRTAAAAILTSGIRVLFAFIHGDEISVLIDPKELANGRKKARLISGIASAASVGLCTALGRGALFHAKVSELPTIDHLVEYLFWQRLVARRNTISRHLSIALTARQESKSDIDRLLMKATEEERIATLARYNIDFESLPPLERLGAFLWWSPCPPPSSIRLEGQPYGIAECLDLPNDDLFELGIRAIANGTSISTEAEAPIFALPFPLR